MKTDSLSIYSFRSPRNLVKPEKTQWGPPCCPVWVSVSAKSKGRCGSGLLLGLCTDSMWTRGPEVHNAPLFFVLYFCLTDFLSCRHTLLFLFHIHPGTRTHTHMYAEEFSPHSWEDRGQWLDAPSWVLQCSPSLKHAHTHLRVQS